MELRVPGIGGPSPESVLGCPPNHAVPSWRSGPSARSMVRHVAGCGDVHVYDWRPLTSGSRSFAVWPLLAPFTLVNLAGWMGPPDRRRAFVHRWAAVLLGATVTVQCVVWFVVTAVCGWTVFIGDDHATTAFWLGIATAAVAMGVVITGATYTAAGFDRFRPASWGAPPRMTWRRPWGASMSRSTSDERFFDTGTEHRWQWRAHVALVAAAMVAVTVWAIAEGAAAHPWAGLGHATLAAGAAPGVAIGVMVLVALPPDASGRRLPARLGAAGTGMLGVLLLGGLMSAALIGVVGIDHVPPGPTLMMFDVYGWVAVGAIAVAALIALIAVQTRSAAERHPPRTALLGSTVARIRARLAPAVPRVDIVLALLATVVPAVMAVVVWVRWVHSDHGRLWQLPHTFGTQLGRWTVLGLAGVMILNLVKSRANPASLRRIGNLWDVITFWPRPFHPFAVRPYTERAVPELREFVLHGPRPSPLVITAHSQGSIVAVAALQPVLDELPPGTALVTFGSPLRDLYARLFPRSFDQPSIDAVGRRLGARWRNLFRYTDHVGRAVFAGDAEVLRRFGDALPSELIGLADRPIADPSPTDRMLEGHNRYWSCTEVRAVVEELAGG